MVGEMMYVGGGGLREVGEERERESAVARTSETGFGGRKSSRQQVDVFLMGRAQSDFVTLSPFCLYSNSYGLMK